MNEREDVDTLQDLLVMTKSKMKMCSSIGCKNKSRRRGLCEKHMIKLSEYHNPASVLSKPCRKCGMPVRCKGLCAVHYQKKRRKEKAKS